MVERCGIAPSWRLRAAATPRGPHLYSRRFAGVRAREVTPKGAGRVYRWALRRLNSRRARNSPGRCEMAHSGAGRRGRRGGAGAVAPKAPGPAPTLFQPYDSVFTALNLTVSSPTRWPRPHRRRDEASFVGLNRQAPGHAALRAPKQHRRPSFGRTANPRTDTLWRDRGRYTLTWEEPLNRRIHITSGAHNIGYPGGATQLRFLRGKEVFTMEQLVDMKAITIWPISK